MIIDDPKQLSTTYETIPALNTTDGPDRSGEDHEDEGKGQQGSKKKLDLIDE